MEIGRPQLSAIRLKLNLLGQQMNLKKQLAISSRSCIRLTSVFFTAAPAEHPAGLRSVLLTLRMKLHTESVGYFRMFTPEEPHRSPAFNQATFSFLSTDGK